MKALFAKRLRPASVFKRKLAQMPFKLADLVWIVVKQAGVTAAPPAKRPH
ncbi:hypothetical protein [Paraburkholderia elongata]|uniref:Uncharacterized protein n=1 Tax=Paraburkholderia elongata TaxID=2675747 RepID=A0A972NMP0_9BURK|nr:hypothetical protein [Paraburkholderia elongata]NPT55103.1 hypothetical protein [Paraburkholderia elongata]